MAVVVEVHDPLLLARARRVVGRTPGVKVVLNGDPRGGLEDAPSKTEAARRIIVGRAARADDSSDDSQATVELLRQGVWAVVLTEPDATRSLETSLKECVAKVGSGLCPLLSKAIDDPAEVEKILAAMKVRPVTRTQRGARKSPLSDGETQILQRIARGDKNREIALDLGFEVQTVKNKVTMVLTKTQARSRTHAVAVALANGWIQ